MQERPKNTFFDGETDTAVMPAVRPTGAHRRIKHVTSVLPAYTGEGANWQFVGWYGECGCGWATKTYGFRGFAGVLANRHQMEPHEFFGR